MRSVERLRPAFSTFLTFHDSWHLLHHSNNSKKVLVTGINGFIAVHITSALLDQGYSVVGTLRSLKKAEYLKQGKGSRDVFSLIVKANASEDERSRLSDREMYDSMRWVLS